MATSSVHTRASRMINTQCSPEEMANAVLFTTLSNNGWQSGVTTWLLQYDRDSGPLMAYSGTESVSRGQ